MTKRKKLLRPPLVDFFEETLKECQSAARNGEIPIGAVLVKDGRIIARAHNQTENKGSFLAHSEILVLQKAAKKLKTKYLVGCELYVNLEPCLMCRTAAQLCRISKIHYLVRSEKFGRNAKRYFKTQVRRSNKKSLAQRSKDLLHEFFASKR